MTQLENTIKEMYQKQATEIMAPDYMKQEIDERISSKNVTGFSFALMSKKAVVLAAAVVLLFGSITTVAAVKIAEVRGYTNVEQDSTDYNDIEKKAKECGYSVTGIEEFSNGYVLNEMRISYNQNYDADGNEVGEVEKILNLNYRNEFKGMQLSLSPDKNLPIAEKSILEEFEVNGVKVYVTQYIHLMIPEDYEMTEEDLELQAAGILGTGVDGVTTEPRYTYYTNIKWSQNGVEYLLMKISQNVDVEDMKTVATEWIMAQ